MLLTARDLEILKAVLRYRYITAEGLIALFGKPRAVYRRLTALYHGGLLQRLFIFDKPQGYGSPKAIYLLDRDGAREVLGDDYGEERVKVGRRARVGRHHLKHSLAISTFQLVLELALEGREDIALDYFSPDMEDRDLAVKVRIGGQRVTIWPDASFTLITPKAAYTYFVEVDQAERKRSRIAQRFLGYWEYVKGDRELLKKTRGVSGAFVLFIAPTTQRRNQLIEIATSVSQIRENLKTRTFWFVSETDISVKKPDLLFSKPIAYNLSREAGYLLPQPPKA